MLTCAIAEALGLGMILPLLEAITNPGEKNILSPFLQVFPASYHLLVICVLMVALILFKNVLLVYREYLTTCFIFRYRKLWTNGIMAKYVSMEYSQLTEKEGVLLNNLINEPNLAAKSLRMMISFTFKVFLALFLYILLFSANWQATLVITTIALALLLLLRGITYRYSIDVGKKKLDLAQQLSAVGVENINAIRQIKIFSLQKQSCQKLADKLDELLNVLLKFGIFRSIPGPLIEVIIVIVLVIILLYLQYIAHIPLKSIIPVLGLFIVTARRFFPTISSLFSERMNLLSYFPSLQLVHELASSKEKMEDLEQGKIIEKLDGDIGFVKVDFAYQPQSPVFKDINLVFPQGKFSAIAGKSGAGKSTMVDLLFGIRKTQQGKIMLGSKDLAEVNLQSWRSLVGYISQSTFLFNATVRENILVGKPDASEEEVIKAAKMAHADGFISQLDQGYDTLLGNLGATLSGGQKQRIAIARILIRDPQVLIFDEATNALDAELEQLVQKTITELVGKKTIIVISHRLSTIKDADILYVLEDGKVIESGKFEELEKAKNLFAK